jgi:pimeloyl-ACP methyl ester carboxylesterase
MQIFNIDDCPRVNFVSGSWVPRKANLPFAPERKYTSESPGKKYNEFAFQTSTDPNRQLGLYLRDDFSRNDNPPIIVIVGGLGFGGPVPANKWRTYLNGWNPILIDTRGAGNSTPMADKETWKTDATVDDLIEIVQSFGLREVGIAGYSFAGTLAIKLAARMRECDMFPSFVLGISPTLASSDKEWCFDARAILATFDDNLRPMAERRWQNLVAPLVQNGSAPTPDDILGYYAFSFRNPRQSAEKFIEVFARMALWEDAPYQHLDEQDYTVNFIKKILSKGIRPGKSLDEFVACLIEGESSHLDFFYNPEQDLEKKIKGGSIDPETMRQDWRAALNLARRMSTIIGWIGSWDKNCGLDKTNVLDTISDLQTSKVDMLLTFNSRDSLLPLDQRVAMAQYDPAIVRLIDTHLHGHEDEAVKRQMFSWLEEKRLSLWKNPRNDDLRLRNRVYELDLTEAVKRSNGDPIRAACIMALTENQRGDREAIIQCAQMLGPDAEPRSQDQRAELRRLTFFAQAKSTYLQGKCAL